MKRSALPQEASSLQVLPTAEAQALHKPVFITFLLLFLLNWVLLLLRIPLSGTGLAIEAALLGLSAATLLVGLARRLPLQNVFACTLLIGGVGSFAAIVNNKTGIPFGPLTYTDNFGHQILGLLPWPVPLLWITGIVSSRGVARLIVRPWRKTNYYGFWVIGLTILFVLLLQMGIEPFAASERHFWIWQTAPSVLNWYGAPWVNFLGWAVVSLGIMVITTPWLINKQPVKQPTDYHPLIVWLLLNIHLMSANALTQRWPAASFTLVVCILASIYAVRGGRW